MSLFDSFLQNIKTNLKNKGCSDGEINEKISKISKKYENEDCLKEIDFSGDNDDDWDDYDFVANTDNEISVVKQMKMNVDDLRETINDDMSSEDRIKILRKYYEDKNVFDDDETISESNLKGAYGRTLLHEAVLEENIDEIEKLIMDGVDVSVKDNNGCTPYQLAVLEEKEESLKKLKEFGIST